MSYRRVEINPGIVYTRVEGAVGIIEFENPQGGFFTNHMLNELDAITLRWQNDSDVRAFILTGKVAGTFITHYSPHELSGTAGNIGECKSDREIERIRAVARRRARFVHRLKRIPPLYRLLDKYGRVSHYGVAFAINQFHAMLTRWQRMNKVVIAAVNGNCMGCGFEIALACDFRLMAKGDFAIGLPEAISAIMPGSGGTQRLARLVGNHRAIELILTGQLPDADRAEALGLITKAVEPHKLLNEAATLASQLAGQPPLSVGNVKRAVLDGSHLPMDKALEVETLCFINTLISRDASTVDQYYFQQLEQGMSPREIFDSLRMGDALDYVGN